MDVESFNKMTHTDFVSLGGGLLRRKRKEGVERVNKRTLIYFQWNYCIRRKKRDKEKRACRVGVCKSVKKSQKLV